MLCRSIIALFVQQGRFITHNGEDIFITFYTEFSSRTHIGLMRLRQDFSIVWNMTWNLHTENYFDTPYKMLIFGEHLYLAGQMNVSAILLKFDLDGNFLLSASFKRYLGSQFGDIIILDNYIYVTGISWDGISWNGDLVKYALDLEKIWEREVDSYLIRQIVASQYYLYAIIESTPKCGVSVWNFEGDLLSITYRDIPDERFIGRKAILNGEKIRKSVV